MFLTFPALGEVPDPTRSPIAALGRLMPSLRAFRFLLLPILFLALGVGCSKHHNSSADPGTAPAITTGPSDASTVTGRPVSFTVVATGAVTVSSSASFLSVTRFIYPSPSALATDWANYRRICTDYMPMAVR